MSDPNPPLQQYATGAVVETVWGVGQVQSYRENDGLYVVLLDNWRLAQGQSPTLYVGAEAMRVREAVADEGRGFRENEEENEDDDYYDDDLLPPTLMRHITIEEDSLPPLPVMIRLASHNAAKQKVACCICDDLVLHGVGHLRLGCRCLCHETCFVKYIRSKSRSDWGREGGIACPYALGAELCQYKGQNNEPYRITPKDLEQMVKLLGNADRFSAATPIDSTFLCDSLITLDEIEKYETWITEIQLAGKSQSDENVPATGSDGIFSAEDIATKVFIDATTKACPKCNLRATHYHGHSCHHIYGGCEGCNEEYCYRCLSTATENTEERGDRTLCPCGSWETFCNNEDLGFFLVTEPYPHDSRCGCTICPDCRPGDPCDMCDGSCVVCDGQIEPPPLDLEALANWKHNCESEDLPAGSIYISGSMIQDINGVYIPDAEECNENDDVISKMMPVYVKKLYEEDDENEIKLKCVAHDNSYRWQIAFDYGNTVSISKPLAYVEIDTNDISLPGRDTMQRPWQVRVNGSYQEKSEVALRLVQPDLELPDELLKKFSTGHAHIVEMRAKYLTELARPPIPGSLKIDGLKSPNERANGVYEPTSKRSNGLTVYHKKGAEFLSFEFVLDSLGCSWRIHQVGFPALAYEAKTVRDEEENDEKEESQHTFAQPNDTVTLPHMHAVGSTVWMVLTESDYVMQPDVNVSLFNPDDDSYSNIPTNGGGGSDSGGESLCSQEFGAAQKHCDMVLSEQRAENLREPVEGSFTLTYCQDIFPRFNFPFNSHQYRCIGTFEPTNVLQRGLPIYAKKGDAAVTLEYFSGNRWQMWAPTVRDKKCAIARVDLCQDHVLPVRSRSYDWAFNTPGNASEYETCDDLRVQATSLSKVLLPPEIFELLSEKYKNSIRDPLPGSVVIKGASGSRQGRVNGTFEPTEEVFNDMPVYRKKGDDDTWLELVTSATGGLRWYIKPTSSRGPGSTCFGYLDQDKTNLLLPHDVGEKHWHVYDGTAFVTQDNQITSALYAPEEPIPNVLLDMLKKRRDVLAKELAEKMALMAMPPVPGSLSIKGATGSRAYGVNGIFEPTDELYNNLPCYKKKGEDIWIEMVHGASGYRWYIKPGANRGSSSVCFGYCKLDETNPALPFDRSQHQWKVYDGKEFSVQESIITKLVPENVPVPDNQLALLAACKAEMDIKLAEVKAKLAIPPIPGSFTISGATGTREHRVNGTFEPTEEVQNGMPVYMKKGDDDTWIELVSVKSSADYRWYIKPTKEKGPNSSVCYAYRGVKAANINLPQNCTEVGWTIYDGKSFGIQSNVTCTLVPAGVAIPKHMQEMVDVASAGTTFSSTTTTLNISTSDSFTTNDTTTSSQDEVGDSGRNKDVDTDKEEKEVK